MRRIIVLATLLGVLTVPAHAKVKTIGSGERLEFDPSRFPPQMKKSYSLMKTKCLVCHSMERTVVAITTGIAPISSTIFDKGSIHAYGVRMLRKPNANLSMQDVEIIEGLLGYLLDDASR